MQIKKPLGHNLELQLYDHKIVNFWKIYGQRVVDPSFKHDLNTPT